MSYAKREPFASTQETVILEIYEAMQESIHTGQPYQTRLGPPPGPPTDTDGKFIPVAAWDESSWPSHIRALRHNTARTKV